MYIFRSKDRREYFVFTTVEIRLEGRTGVRDDRGVGPDLIVGGEW